MNIIRPAVEQALAISALARQRMNPITGEPLVGLILGRPENDVRETCLAVLAREWFGLRYPGLPQLPLSDEEIEGLKTKGDESMAVALYARSLKANEWDFKGHPGFEEFVGGLRCLSCPDLPKLWSTAEFRDYQNRFRPYPLAGLYPSGIWKPPVH